MTESNVVEQCEKYRTSVMQAIDNLNLDQTHKNRLVIHFQRVYLDLIMEMTIPPSNESALALR